MLLHRDVLKAAGRSGLDVSTFDEAVALGDAAAAASQWEQARDTYNKALEIAEKTKRDDPEGIAAVREALAVAQFMIARDLFLKGKYNECIEMAGRHRVRRSGAPDRAEVELCRRRRRRRWPWQRR